MKHQNTTTDEGLGSILGGKIADLAKGLIFKPRPIVVLWNAASDKVVSLKIKRGLIRHSLIVAEGEIDKVVAKDQSSAKLVEVLLHRVNELKRKGFIEI